MSTRKSSHPTPIHQGVQHGGHHLGRHVGRHIELDGGDAFVPDFRRGLGALKDNEAEAFGEEFVSSATSAEAVAESARDEFASDELGGFVVESPLDDENED